MKEKFTKGPCIIRWSQLPKDQWLRIQLIEPSKCLKMCIRNSGEYIGFKAVWISEFIKDKKPFTIMFKKMLFERAMISVDKELRQPTRPVQFTFMKTRLGMRLKDWVVI